MSYVTYQGKMIKSAGKFVVGSQSPTFAGVIYFQPGSIVEFDTQPDVTGNKTFSSNLFIDSSASSEIAIGLMNALNDFLFISYTVSADTGPSKVLAVNTKNSPPYVLRPYYNIDSYLNQIITLEVIKTSSAITSVKINGNTLTKAGDGYFNNGATTIKQISGQYFSIWNVQVNGVAAWTGYPNGDTYDAWVDTIGSNDGVVSGGPTTRDLF